MKMIMSTVSTITVEIAETTSGSMFSFYYPPYKYSPMLVAKYSEPLLKGKQTRARLERILAENVRGALNAAGALDFKMRKEGGLLLMEASGEGSLVQPLLRVFGINSVSVCSKVPVEPPAIHGACVAAAQGFHEGSSFAIRARKSGIHPFTSPQLGAECGAAVLDAFPEKRLKVNLDSPDNEVFVDVRQEFALISQKIFGGPGGMPVGSQGKAVCIATDSSRSLLAAWMMAKRGVLPVLLFPESFGREAALDAAGRLGEWLPGLGLSAYAAGVPASRRALLEAACILAQEVHADSVVSGDLFNEISGEGVLESLDKGLPLPVFRPLIGFDSEMLNSHLIRTGLEGTAHEAIERKGIKESLAKIKFERIL